MRRPNLLAFLLVIGTLGSKASVGGSASSFDDLRKQYPDLTRLLTLAAPKSGLSQEQLDKALDNIAKWALESKSQQVRESIELLVDKGRLDYFQAMKDFAPRIKYDGDASEWPEWTCLWKGYETPWLLQEGDLTAFRAIYDEQRLSVAVDLPQRPPPDVSEVYWARFDLAGDRRYEISVRLAPGQRVYWYRTGEAKPIGVSPGPLGARRTIEVDLPTEVTGATAKSTLGLHLMGPKRKDGSQQKLAAAMPFDPGLEAARELICHACGKGLETEGALPEALLAIIREDRGTLARLRRVANVYVLLDDGSISLPIEPGEGIVPEAEGELGINVHAATRTFIRVGGWTPQRPDPYDYVVLFLNYGVFAMPKEGLTKIQRYALRVRNAARGVGRDPMDLRPIYDSVGRLKCVAQMNSIHARDAGNEVRLLLSMVHEFAHLWIAFARFDADPGPTVTSSASLLSTRQVHWSHFMQRKGSMMAGLSPGSHMVSELYALENGGFELRRFPDLPSFSDLDLYLIGLLPPEQVKPFFVVLNPDVREPDLKIGQPFRGTRKDVTIQDIIAVEGPRIPDWQHSQKDFRAAFVLVTGGEMPTDEEIKFVDNLRQEFEEYWFKATRGLSRMDTRLDHSITDDAMRPSGGNEASAGN